MTQLLDSRHESPSAFSPSINANKALPLKVMLLSTAAVLCIQPTSQAFPSETRQFIPPNSGGQVLKQNTLKLELLRRIDELSMGQDICSDEDSEAPTAQAIQDAKCFINTLGVLPRFYEPHISITDDGEINFWWNLPHSKIDLAIFGNGNYVYYAKTSDGKEYLNDKIPVASLTPILEALLAINTL